ncbi:MAG: hypothetical protein V1860_00780 [bacterium]
MFLNSERCRSFDIVRFFLIFLVWFAGIWAILHTMNKVEKEGMAMFDYGIEVEHNIKN